MNTFKVNLHEDKDSHFKTAIKAFDKTAIVIYNDVEKYYTVTTSLSIEDLRSFTSVSKVEYSYVVSDSWAQRHGYGHGGYDTSGATFDSGYIYPGS